MAFHLLLNHSPHHLELTDPDQHFHPKQEQQIARLLLTWEGWGRAPGDSHCNSLPVFISISWRKKPCQGGQLTHQLLLAGPNDCQVFLGNQSPLTALPRKDFLLPGGCLIRTTNNRESGEGSGMKQCLSCREPSDCRGKAEQSLLASPRGVETDFLPKCVNKLLSIFRMTSCNADLDPAAHPLSSYTFSPHYISMLISFIFKN